MNLSELLNSVEYKGAPDLSAEVRDVVSNSNKVSEGSVFVCIKGRRFDGHSAAADALKNGAVAVVCERPLGLEGEIVVEDTREALAQLCRSFFGNPQRKLKVVAVTGTNGKTTITTVIKQALEHMGYRSGLIGTVRCEIGDLAVPAKFTTPEPWDLYALFGRMVNAGCSHVVMEASSQALDQGRLAGLTFDSAVFTNLTQDHLDYHGDMQSYFEAKKLLFKNARKCVVNVDDDYGRRLAEELRDVMTVSGREGADVFARDAEFRVNGIDFTLCGGDGFEQRARFPMPGVYSLHNALCAAGALFSLGLDRARVCEALGQTRGVRGRCEVVYSGRFTVICDYAHTGDALEQLLSSIKPFAEGRLVTLFGCAGDRDPDKRPAMARAVCRYSDLAVLTSDNPRTEDPLKIIKEVAPYIAQSGISYTAVPDRYYAVRWALDCMRDGDVLLLCGKGHEDYQVIDGCTVYLDEHRIVRDYIKEKGL